MTPVGSGASARVYLAEDTTLRRRVAVKVLHAGLANDERFRRRFRAEAQASAQMSHLNLMAVYDWSEAGELAGAAVPAYLVTELLTGGSLRSLLDTGYRLSLSQALVVGLHAAEGLAYAHDRGFVHRDVKPANLLFGAEGRLRIADFGIARAVAEAAWTEPEGTLVGTARYAAPEQAVGSTVDGRADVYALALTLIEAVTGDVPLVTSSPLATMVQRQGSDLPVPAELGSLQAALEAAGRAAVEQRSTAAELASALRSAAAELPRPLRLPLTGLPHDPRRTEDKTASHRLPTFDAETEVLVLDEATATLDLSGGTLRESRERPARPVTTEPIAADVAESIAERSTPSLGADPPIGRNPIPNEDVEFEDRRRAWPILLLLAVLMGGAAVAYQNRSGSDVVVSEAGIPTHPVGTYVGRSLEEARADIDRNLWSAVTTEIASEEVPAGVVIEQSPESGLELEEGSTVTLVISSGPPPRPVPRLVGLPREVALAELADAGFFLGATGEIYDEEAPPLQIVSASIDPLVEAAKGTAIDLVWSLGPAPRSVPDLTGQTLDEARATLADLGLELVATEEGEFSQDVPEGAVVRSLPGPAATVARGDQITVVLSRGLPFIEVPDVVGMGAAEAADALEALGFVVTDTVGPPNGEVLTTDPPAGEFIRQGSPIRIVTRS